MQKYDPILFNVMCGAVRLHVPLLSPNSVAEFNTNTCILSCRYICVVIICNNVKNEKKNPANEPTPTCHRKNTPILYCVSFVV